MTDLVKDGIFGNLYPLLRFMFTKHTDPVDRLVARALNLRWNAYTGHHCLPKDTAASEATLRAEILADLVLTEVQKQRHYDVLVPIVEAFKAEHGDFAEKMGMTSPPSVIEHIAHYEAILDDCEIPTDGDEYVEAAGSKADVNAFCQPDFGSFSHDVVSHELISHDYRPLRVLTDPFGW
jgi:hypothetical protein